jgi:hypothetical protein
MFGRTLRKGPNDLLCLILFDLDNVGLFLFPTKLLAFNLSVFKYTTKILYAFRLLPQQPTYLVVGLQLVHSVLCFFFMFYVLYVVSFKSFLSFPGSN